MPREPKSKRKSKPTARGGKRPGAGRPRDKPGPSGIPWTTVRKYARLGADRDLVVAALGLTADQLREPAVIARLQEELARGAALHRVDLLVDVQRVRKGGAGKVNAVIASLKQSSGWGKNDTKGGSGQRPDAESAVAEIQRMLGRFRAGPR